MDNIKITVGLGTCGISAGGMPVYDTLVKEGFTVEKVGCIGMCYNEPLVTVIDDKKSVYGNVTEKNVSKLIKCLKEGKECKELLVCNEIEELDFYKKQKRLVMANCGIISPLNLTEYEHTKLERLFKDKVSFFPFYGGDIESFILQCKISHSRNLPVETVQKQLTYQNILDGMNQYIKFRNLKKKLKQTGIYI